MYNRFPYFVTISCFLFSSPWFDDKKSTLVTEVVQYIKIKSYIITKLFSIFNSFHLTSSRLNILVDSSDNTWDEPARRKALEMTLSYLENIFPSRDTSAIPFLVIFFRELKSRCLSKFFKSPPLFFIGLSSNIRIFYRILLKKIESL